MIPYKLLTKCASLISVEGNIPEVGEFNFNSDSRLFKPDCVFFAIPGEKFNPVDFIIPLKDKGLKTAIVERSDENILKLRNHPINIIWVSNVVTYIQELAKHLVFDWRSENRKIFAISGSNGKTTTKEMLAFILNTALPHKIVSTEKNNNNHLGVPFTLFKITKETEVVVLELGSNHPGEIKELCEIAEPDSGVVTNIGATHLEFFGSEEAVYKEEGYLYHSIQKTTQGTGLFFQNGEDEFLKANLKTNNTITYGFNDHHDYKFSFDGSKIIITGKDNIILDNKFITGSHNQWNMALSWIIASTLYPHLKNEFKEASEHFKPTKNRSEWVNFKNKAVFLDAYNANPSSMKAAIKGFSEEISLKNDNPMEATLILGDMNELGELAPQYHQEIGQFLKQYNYHRVFFIGRYKEYYLKGFPQGTGVENVQKFKNDYWPQILTESSKIFIKGSRSLQLESILDIT